ncbi:MAG TPA: hypothetical protein VFG08_01350, partial [Candidatus Polarisedimenticolia bacterium]|nr:hypothetical protein [Candidatus Polarisedimenticolia bacterium]
AAAASLGRMHAEGASRFLQQQLGRDSNWWDAIRLGALLGLAELEDPALVPIFKEYVIPRYPRQVRLAALDGWFRATPGDAALAAQLRTLTRDRNGNVRSDALEKLGRLHLRQDVEFLQAFAREEPDPNLAQAARDAIDEIEAFVAP